MFNGCLVSINILFEPFCFFVILFVKYVWIGF